jgi:GxxExxY protein
MNANNLYYGRESYAIVGACMEVHNALGRGFHEAVYKDALEVEFRERGIPFRREVRYRVEYKGVELGHDYAADFVLFDQIILECKAMESIHPDHRKQLLNYLAASRLKLGILVNFGSVSLQHERVVL